MRFLILFIVCISLSCSKESFLSEKPNGSAVVPSTMKELQAILDQDRDMNGMGLVGRGPVPNLGEIGSDSYYVTDQVYNSILATQMQNYYRWSEHPYEDMEEYSWRWPYLSVFTANVVLDELLTIERTIANEEEYDYLQGSALFYRAHAYYQLAQVFAPPYQAEKAKELPGLPLRESADLNMPNKWVSLAELYSTIIDDLKESLMLMGEQKRSPLTRPSGQAALALLARIHLCMHDFEKAKDFAEKALSIGDDILDYNSLDLNLNFPFSTFSLTNPEIIFACNMVGNQVVNYPTRIYLANVDSALLQMYKVGDLRREVFYNFDNDGLATYKGSYNGDEYFFAGITTSELYLIIAECYARFENIEKSLNYLNKLLEKRWDQKKTFVPLKAFSRQEAVELVIEERRKELVFRALRWTDIRRLNLDGAEIVQSRTINGETIKLLPNDSRYVWPLPPEVEVFNPTLQN